LILDDLLQTLHTLGTKTLSKLGQRRAVQITMGRILRRWRVKDATKVHPIDILMEHLNHYLVTHIIAMLQDVKTNHEPNVFGLTTLGTVVTRECFIDPRPVDSLRKPNQFVGLIDELAK